MFVCLYLGFCYDWNRVSPNFLKFFQANGVVEDVIRKMFWIEMSRHRCVGSCSMSVGPSCDMWAHVHQKVSNAVICVRGTANSIVSVFLEHVVFCG